MPVISKHTLCAQILTDPTHVTAKLATYLVDVFVQVDMQLMRYIILFLANQILINPTTFTIDINECVVDIVCDHFCTNTEGSFTCDCMPGFSQTLNEIGCLGKNA